MNSKKHLTNYPIMINIEATKQRKRIWKFLPVIVFVLVCLIACHVKFKNDDEALAILNRQLSITAGEEITFDLTLMINNYDATQDRIVMAVLVPKIWRGKDNITITYTCPDLFGDSKIRTTSWIPDETKPLNSYTSYTWGDALKAHMSDDPNIPGADMEWVPFITDDIGDLGQGANFTADVKVTIKTTTDNVRCKIGFYTCNEKDGISTQPFVGSVTDYQGWVYTDCFETTGGDGGIIDYCEMHYNLTTPGPGISTQNDILTFKYQGGVGANQNGLSNLEDIYINMTVYTKSGIEITKKVKMDRESLYGKTYAITFWPEEFFDIARSEELDRIEYYYSNADGSVFVDSYDDEHKDDYNYTRPGGEPLTPFLYQFRCK